MEKFTVVTGVAAPMLMTNINTDLIAPSLMPGHTPDQTAKLTLREKIEHDPSKPHCIVTVWGAGYRFDGGLT